jgi:DNA polymerase mu
MPDKRSAPQGSVSPDRPQKRRRSESTDSNEGSSKQSFKVYLIQEKLDEKQISEIYHLIESHSHKDNDGLQLQSCSDPAKADVIITNIRMLKRLERHLDWHIAVRTIF